MSAGTAPFLTIGQLADELGLPQHILRYWETRFSQLKPLTRAGNRRYYRPQDAELARQINHLLNVQGFTVKGVQKLLAQGHIVAEGMAPDALLLKSDVPERSTHAPPPDRPHPNDEDNSRYRSALLVLRDHLQAALDADNRAAA
jgi:DNA-binding transcriptional MerR regulator